MFYLCPTYTKYFRLASLVYTSILLHGLNTNASLLSLKETGNTVNFHANEVFVFIFVAMRDVAMLQYMWRKVYQLELLYLGNYLQE